VVIRNLETATPVGARASPRPPGGCWNFCYSQSVRDTADIDGHDRPRQGAAEVDVALSGRERPGRRRARSVGAPSLTIRGCVVSPGTLRPRGRSYSTDVEHCRQNALSALGTLILRVAGNDIPEDQGGGDSPSTRPVPVDQ
jgi:hypothetical protein